MARSTEIPFAELAAKTNYSFFFIICITVGYFSYLYFF